MVHCCKCGSGFDIADGVMCCTCAPIGYSTRFDEELIKAETSKMIVEDQLNYLIDIGLCFIDSGEKDSIRDNLYRIVYTKLSRLE